MRKGGLRAISETRDHSEFQREGRLNSPLAKGKREEYKFNYPSRKDSVFENDLWNANDVSKFLKCSVKHIYNLVWKDEIPFVKIGGLLRFRKEQLETWLNERSTL